MNSRSVSFGEFTESFVRAELLSRLPEIAAVILGGSRLYKEAAQVAPDSDWDGIVIVHDKHDILTLVNEKRGSLLSLLDLEKEEEYAGPSLRVPEPSSPLWSEFDAVRISGFDRRGAKRSVKILSLDYFSQGKTSLDILSYKDRRVFERIRPGGMSYLVQQVTTLPNQMRIIHDQWVFEAPLSSGAAAAEFGVTSDLIVSGACIVGPEYGLSIKKQIVSHWSSVSGLVLTIDTFARVSRFSPKYKEWLNRELTTLQSPFEITPPPEGSSRSGRKKPVFLYGNTAITQVSIPIPSTSNALSEDAIVHFEQDQVTAPSTTRTAGTSWCRRRRTRRRARSCSSTTRSPGSTPSCWTWRSRSTTTCSSRPCTMATSPIHPRPPPYLLPASGWAGSGSRCLTGWRVVEAGSFGESRPGGSAK
ncbi:hypothetical protein F4778DRAFT_453847 [Xylariomycetidae sp. FL2044]|nr:hypothetical protein F4778DRAFT_453847 [Xylariomycetidae sp. FL2044]